MQDPAHKLADGSESDLARVGARLSPRELEIGKLISHGLPNKRIAFLLGISEQTVKNHVTRLLEKTNSSSRVQVAVALYHVARGEGQQLALPLSDVALITVAPL